MLLHLYHHWFLKNPSTKHGINKNQWDCMMMYIFCRSNGETMNMKTLFPSEPNDNIKRGIILLQLSKLNKCCSKI